jgi:hypothetical protein
MSNLPSFSITYTFNGDVSASSKVNASALDTQLANIATAQNQTKTVLDTITDSSNNLAAQTVGLAQLKPEVTSAMKIVGTVYDQKVLGTLIVGQSTTTIDATSPEKMVIDYGTTTNTTYLRGRGNVASFLQSDVKNTSAATGAQSGHGATADTGTDTTGFVFAGINNSGPALVAAYNIGGPLDVNFMGSGNDLYIANTSNTKDIIFACGKAASPFFNYWGRITNAGLWQTDCARKKNTLSVTTAAGTTTGTALDHVVIFTGSTTQTYTMPACATGREIILINRSTGAITVNRAGADTINSGTTTSLTTGQMGHFIGNVADFAGRVF